MIDRNRFGLGAALMAVGLLVATTLAAGFSVCTFFSAVTLLAGGAALIWTAFPARDDADDRIAGAILGGGGLFDAVMGPFGPEPALRRVSEAAQACATPATRELRLALLPSPADPIALIDFELRCDPENTLSGVGTPALQRAVEALGLARAKAASAPIAFTMTGTRNADGTWTWSWSA